MDWGKRCELNRAKEGVGGEEDPGDSERKSYL